MEGLVGLGIGMIAGTAIVNSRTDRFSPRVRAALPALAAGVLAGAVSAIGLAVVPAWLIDGYRGDPALVPDAIGYLFARAPSVIGRLLVEAIVGLIALGIVFVVGAFVIGIFVAWLSEDFAGLLVLIWGGICVLAVLSGIYEWFVELSISPPARVGTVALLVAFVSVLIVYPVVLRLIRNHTGVEAAGGTHATLVGIGVLIVPAWALGYLGTFDPIRMVGFLVGGMIGAAGVDRLASGRIGLPNLSAQDLSTLSSSTPNLLSVAVPNLPFRGGDETDELEELLERTERIAERHDVEPRSDALERYRRGESVEEIGTREIRRVAMEVRARRRLGTVEERLESREFPSRELRAELDRAEEQIETNDYQRAVERLRDLSRQVENTPANPKATDEPVDAIAGIGSAFSERLDEIGIETVGDLLESDPAEITDSIEVSIDRVETWQKRAERL